MSPSCRYDDCLRGLMDRVMRDIVVQVLEQRFLSFCQDRTLPPTPVEAVAVDLLVARLPETYDFHPDAVVNHLSWINGVLRRALQRKTNCRVRCVVDRKTGRQRCAHPGCLNTDNLAWCTQCYALAYCSDECQRADWQRQHREECQQFCVLMSQKRCARCGFYCDTVIRAVTAEMLKKRTRKLRNTGKRRVYCQFPALA